MKTDEMRFDGRVALITGAGNGMGRTHSLLLASRGAIVLVNELPKSIALAEAVVAEIVKGGGKAIAVAGQVGIDEDAKRMVQTAIDQFGRIDIIINNAGIPGGGKDDIWVQDAPTERMERFLDVHIRGPLQINRAAWPHMVKQNYGRILFVGSANGTGWKKGIDGYETDYAGVKSMVFGVARQTAGAGLDHNIMVNILMPWAYTKMVSDVLNGTELGAWMQANLRPEQVSNGIAYFLHEDCQVTGEAISIQAGRVARIFFAATTGYLNPDLVPEDVPKHLDEILGTITPEGVLANVYEQSQPREEILIAEMLKKRSLPELKWLSAQGVKEAGMES